MPPYQYTRCTEPHFLRKSNLLRAVGVRKVFHFKCKAFSSTFGLSHYYEAMPHKWEDF